MRVEGEAVALCTPGPSLDWGGGLTCTGCRMDPKKSSFPSIATKEIRQGNAKEKMEMEIEDGQGEGHVPDLEMLLRPLPGPHMASHPEFVVGYALTSKKTKSFLQPKLEEHARNKGILFVAVDLNRSLKDQGPFDVILQKMSGRKWQQELEAYKELHPDVTVLDPPKAIEHLYNRQSMLQDVANMNLCCLQGRVGVPKQLVVTGDDSTTIAELVSKAGLKFPLVAKPLLIDGTEKSHALSLAMSMQSLSGLAPPLVLQEFVNHGGVLFKVYIVGNNIKVVRRFSVPDLHEEDNYFGLVSLPRVSCAAASADEAELDPRVGELPPLELLESLSKELRQRLGLQLFNLDIIRHSKNKDSYYVIDINYFPGLGKMPDYEFVFTDFLLSLAQSKGKDVGG